MHTIKQLEKRKLIQIGFYQRNTLLHIVNWAEKYASSQDFYVSLTKKGQAELAAW
jgi:DNA-binding MarR family transcriptional regulator